MAIVTITEGAKQHELYTIFGTACLDRSLIVAKRDKLDYLVSAYCGGTFVVESKKVKRNKGFTWHQRLMLRSEAESDAKVASVLRTPGANGFFTAELKP